MSKKHSTNVKLGIPTAAWDNIYEQVQISEDFQPKISDFFRMKENKEEQHSDPENLIRGAVLWAKIKRKIEHLEKQEDKRSLFGSLKDLKRIDSLLGSWDVVDGEIFVQPIITSKYYEPDWGDE